MAHHARHIGAVLAATFALVATHANADILFVPDEYPTIQDAINAANDGDEVHVSSGIYNEALDLLGKDILVLGVDGAANTALDGTGLGVSIITMTSGETTSTEIKGFTITHGEGTFTFDCGLFGFLGGGVFIGDRSDATFTECAFIDNAGLTGGGAIWACEAGVVINRCTFDLNQASYGGAVYGASEGSRSDYEVRDTTFTSNESSFGGGLNFDGDFSTNVIVTDCDFDGNDASHGGGIFAFLGTNATIDVERCNFDNNVSSHGGGLVFHVDDDVQANIVDCSFTNGTASFGAGANISGSTLGGTLTANVIRCDFVNNLAGFGGGLMAYTSNGGIVNVNECTFLGNTANGCCNTGIYWTECYVDGSTNGQFFGGGAEIRTIYGGTISLNNNLFAHNTATLAGAAHLSNCLGGEIFFNNNTVVDNTPTGLHLRLSGEGTTEITNAIIRDNGSPQIETLFEGDVSGTVAYSNIEGGFNGTANFDLDPQFVDPSNDDFRLSMGSPCIDAGDNGAVPADITTDLDGASRFRGSFVDMGPYERAQNASEFIVRPPQPGLADATNVIDAGGAAPGATVVYVYGFNAGQTPVPGCPGTFFDIANPQLAGIATADENGFARLSSDVPPQALGITVLVQAGQPASCTIADVVSRTFE